MQQENGRPQQNGMNSVVIIGRAGKDPEVKYFETGTVRASFSLAVNRIGGSKDNPITDWFNIDAWGRTAEIVAQYLKKGREAAVAGRLNVRKWTDEAGNERDALSINASEVKFLGSRRDNEEGGGYGGGAAYSGAGAASAMGGGGNQAPF